MRGGVAEIAVGSTELRAGDQVLAIIQPGAEGELRALLLAEGKRALPSTIRGWPG
jgi:Trk K+ transport system NAD-binding subunit